MLHAMLTWLCLVICFCNNVFVLSNSVNSTKSLIIRSTPTTIQPRECTSVDIRNDCESFSVLEGCTVITGYVLITLVPNQYKPRCQYDNITFPLLREITEYIIFYDVRGLTSVRNMFPNLTVIRGRRLFLNYALGMTNLQELRLLEFKSLVAIQSGHVYIGSSPKLCQFEKINWDLLTLSKGENYMNVKPRNCTQSAECKGCDSEHCWSNFVCQRFQNDNLANQMLDTTQCHEQCLGGCYNTTNAGCVVCKGLTDHGVCVKECPPEKLLSEQFQRCYTRDECLGKPGYLIFNTSCVPFCPSGLTADANRVCVPCEENVACISTCAAEYIDENLVISSLSEADDIRGCQIVNSSLEIRISSDLNEDELAERLTSLREIRGYLKIYKSAHLKSLKFLSSIQRIYGDPLENDHYGIILYDNKNLRELWKPEQLELKRGGIYMHRNNKLCNRRMREFQELITHDKSLDTLQTNDQDVLCEPSKINLLIFEKSHRAVDLSWLKQKTSDELEVIYRKVPFGQKVFNETQLEMPVCTRINWERRLIFPHELTDNGTHYTLRIDDLEPNTRYGFLLRTFGSDYTRDARSDLTYAWTFEDVPFPPVFAVIKKSNTTMTIQIKEVKESKEKIGYYMLNVFELLDDRVYLDHRNYCKQPSRILKDMERFESSFGTEDYDDCCVLQMEKAKDERFMTAIRDEFRCTLDTRQYCQLDRNKLNEEVLQKPWKSTRLTNKMTTYPLIGMESYRVYSIQLQACNNFGCSSHSTLTTRTNITIRSSELLPDFNVCQSPKFDGKYYVRFSEPKQRNAIVVSYVVHYRRQRPDSDLYDSHISCVTRLRHEKSQFLYINDVKENFTEAAVRVHFLAGDVLTEWRNITICTPLQIATNTIAEDLNLITPLEGKHLSNLSKIILCFLPVVAGAIIWLTYKCRSWRRLPQIQQFIPAALPEEQQGDREILVNSYDTVRFQNIAREDT